MAAAAPLHRKSAPLTLLQAPARQESLPRQLLPLLLLELLLGPAGMWAKAQSWL